MEDALLHVPERFGTVAPQVYRSSVFHPEHFPFLATLRLRTIVHISPEVTLRAVSRFLSDHDIRLVHLGIKFWRPSGWSPIAGELVKEALETVLDEDNHPIMLMCTSGVHHTGTVVGCLRRLQRHSFTSVIEELRHFAFPTHTRNANESFIEFFDVDLVSFPNNVPEWFAREQRYIEAGAPAYDARQGKKEAGKAEEEEDDDDVVQDNNENIPAYIRFFNDMEGPLVETFLKDVEQRETDVDANANADANADAEASSARNDAGESGSSVKAPANSAPKQSAKSKSDGSSAVVFLVERPATSPIPIPSPSPSQR